MRKLLLSVVGFGALAFFARLLPEEKPRVDELLAEVRSRKLMPYIDVTAYGRWRVRIHQSQVRRDGKDLILLWDEEFRVEETHEDLVIALRRALSASEI